MSYQIALRWLAREMPFARFKYGQIPRPLFAWHKHKMGDIVSTHYVNICGGSYPTPLIIANHRTYSSVGFLN